MVRDQEPRHIALEKELKKERDEAAASAEYLGKRLKDLDENAPTMRKIVEDLYGANEYARLQHAAAENYSKIVDEIIEFKPELGSI